MGYWLLFKHSFHHPLPAPHSILSSTNESDPPVHHPVWWCDFVALADQSGHYPNYVVSCIRTADRRLRVLLKMILVVDVSAGAVPQLLAGTGRDGRSYRAVHLGKNGARVWAQEDGD